MCNDFLTGREDDIGKEDDGGDRGIEMSELPEVSAGEGVIGITLRDVSVPDASEPSVHVSVTNYSIYSSNETLNNSIQNQFKYR